MSPATEDEASVVLQRGLGIDAEDGAGQVAANVVRSVWLQRGLGIDAEDGAGQVAANVVRSVCLRIPA